MTTMTATAAMATATETETTTLSAGRRVLCEKGEQRSAQPSQRARTIRSFKLQRSHLSMREGWTVA
eukprot:11703249-Karenia_brevis.AAC.1